MILQEDLFEFINTYKNQILLNIQHTVRTDVPDIKKEIYQKLSDKYSLKESNLDISSQYYLKQYIDTSIRKMIDDHNQHQFNKIHLLTKLEKLKQLTLPEQRSKEWYEMRETMLTASSLADALGKGHFKKRDDLLIEKTSKEPPARFWSHIIEWGVRYEAVATTFYEKMNNLKVLEFGLVPHPELKIFGASPDGICDENSPKDFIGRMLEIKCPPIRKFTKEVPDHYWMQMQGQLESCDLEECDFLQVKLEEYNDESEYIEDKVSDEEFKEGITSKGFPKGLVLSFVKTINGETKYHYEYSEFYTSFEDIKTWSIKVIEDYPFEYDKVVYHWWSIERYECTLVHRDRKWWLETVPEILNFWEDVEHYRKIGNQELLDKKEEKKQKRKNSRKKKETKKDTKNIITINQDIMKQVENNYLLGSDSD
jgi:putative phage-type endonuclease